MNVAKFKKTPFLQKNLWKTASSVVVRRTLLVWVKSSTTNFTLLLHKGISLK